MQINIEIEDGIMFIAEENSSGSEYLYKNKQDIINAFTEYVNNYILEEEI